ncbi:MAG TPA: polyhydroxyalkanoate depolymerase [Hyphomicrobiaceae bacterium]|nr:polyhydroxyalkanoate depolymerase [Hyphomicrobiaceae bacterium]
MLYQWYELGHAAFRPARVAAGSARMLLSNPFNPLTHTPAGRHAMAALEVFERTTRRYARPEFGITHTMIGGEKVPIVEEIIWERPFCRIVRFRRMTDERRTAADPRILLVAPMSGHFATLLRGTVETLIPDHDVYITDWQDARNVPLIAGRFDLDDYIHYVEAMLRHFEGDVHVFAVCQPSVPVMAAIASMEADNDPAVPRTVTLAGGPIDTRHNPTVVNALAEKRGIDWFQNNVVTSVPWPCRGFGRMVYPGFLQLSGFMTMNLDRHLAAHKDLFLHLVRGDGDSAEKHREFYDEYLAVMDLTAEFFLQTVETVFIRHALPKGEMIHRGRRVDLGAIRRVPLMTIEGEKDDITGLGQCKAAHLLCRNIPEDDRVHFECPHVGHYGIFNGSRFRSQIAPRIAQFARTYDHRLGEARAHIGWVPPSVAASPSRTPGPIDASAVAFTFANEAGDHVAAERQPAKLEANDNAAPAPTSVGGSAVAVAMGAQFAQLRLLGAAGSMLLDNVARVSARSAG